MIIRPVVPGRAVRDPSEPLNHFEMLIRADMLGTLEEKVFKQMGEAGLPRFFVARTDAIPKIDRDKRRRGVAMKNDSEPVRKAERFERNDRAAVDGRRSNKGCCHGRCGVPEGSAAGQGKDNWLARLESSCET